MLSVKGKLAQLGACIVCFQLQCFHFTPTGHAGTNPVQRQPPRPSPEEISQRSVDLLLTEYYKVCHTVVRACCGCGCGCCVGLQLGRGLRWHSHAPLPTCLLQLLTDGEE